MRWVIILKSRVRFFLACVLYMLARLLPSSLRHNFCGKTRVLVFHHIDHPKRFWSILNTLNKNYRFVSFQQYLEGKISADRINIVITLDDGYRSWLHAALPSFQEFGIRPLVFINSDFIGLDEETGKTYCRQSITTWPEAGLSWPEIHILEEAGGEIGGHSRGHIDLVACEKIERIHAAVSNDRREIGRALGHPIRAFAYPFGRYDDRSLEAVASAGYDFGFTCDSGFLDDSQGPLLLKRSNIGLRSPLTVCAVVEGWADRVSEIVRFIKGKPPAP